MHKYVYTCFFIFILSHSYCQQCDTAIGFQNMFWFKGIGNFGGSFIRKIIEDKNGDIITGGTINIPGIPAKSKVLITKSTKKGTLLWAKTFEFVVSNVFYDIKLTKDGGYIFAVQLYEEESTLIIKVSPDGIVRWSSYLLNNASQEIIQLNDESFIVTGTEGHTLGEGDFITHLDKQGKLIWGKKFSLDTHHVGTATNILELHDGTLLVSGSDFQIAPITGATRFFLRKLDIATGNAVWSRFYVAKDSTDRIENFGELHALPDHTFHVHLNNSPGSNISLKNTYYHFDSAGNYLDGKKITLNSPNYFVDANYTATDDRDNDLFYGNVTGTAAYKILFKVSNDAVIWAHSYSSSLNMGILRELTAATIGNNSFIIAGNFITRNLSTNTNKDEYQNYLIKTDKNGNTNCSDTFNIPFAINNTDPLIPFTASWVDSSGISVAPKLPIVQDLLPQQVVDCLPKNPCCRDTIVYVDDAICRNNIYTLPDQTTVTEGGIYSSYFKTPKGCDSVIFTSLVQITEPKISLGKDTCLGGSSSLILRLQNNGVTKYLWQDGTSDSTYTVKQEGLYWVKATSLCGTTSDSIMIYSKCNLPAYIPNAFTPDANGLNDVFRIGDMKNQELIDFSIYNRWGERVFITKDPAKGWNGKLNGIDQPVSTFVYLIRYKDFTGKLQYVKGTVTLIR